MADIQIKILLKLSIVEYMNGKLLKILYFDILLIKILIKMINY